MISCYETGTTPTGTLVLDDQPAEWVQLTMYLQEQMRLSELKWRQTTNPFGG